MRVMRVMVAGLPDAERWEDGWDGEITGTGGWVMDRRRRHHHRPHHHAYTLRQALHQALRQDRHHQSPR